MQLNNREYKVLGGGEGPQCSLVASSQSPQRQSPTLSLKSKEVNQGRSRKRVPSSQRHPGAQAPGKSKLRGRLRWAVAGTEEEEAGPVTMVLDSC